MKRILCLVVLIIVLFNVFESRAEDNVLRLATTTSTYETGLLDYIFPDFEKNNNCKVHIISAGTGKAIEIAKNGDVDIILVHARAAEEKFIQDGFGVERFDVMYNDFIIVGQENDPAKIKGLTNAVDVLKRIYNSKNTFVSRGDDSGTHKKEKGLWKKAGLDPKGSWYLETGQGMNATLRVADEKNAYLLIDRATYLFNKENIKLKILAQGANELLNHYGVVGVNPDRHPHVNHELSMKLIEYLTSGKCRKMIKNYKVKGEQLFYVVEESENFLAPHPERALKSEGSR